MFHFELNCKLGDVVDKQREWRHEEKSGQVYENKLFVFTCVLLIIMSNSVVQENHASEQICQKEPDKESKFESLAFCHSTFSQSPILIN